MFAEQSVEITIALRVTITFMTGNGFALPLVARSAVSSGHGKTKPRYDDSRVLPVCWSVGRTVCLDVTEKFDLQIA